jgi:hypothetical protein
MDYYRLKAFYWDFGTSCDDMKLYSKYAKCISLGFQKHPPSESNTPKIVLLNPMNRDSQDTTGNDNRDSAISEEVPSTLNPQGGYTSVAYNMRDLPTQ